MFFGLRRKADTRGVYERPELPADSLEDSLSLRPLLTCWPPDRYLWAGIDRDHWYSFLRSRKPQRSYLRRKRSRLICSMGTMLGLLNHRKPIEPGLLPVRAIRSSSHKTNLCHEVSRSSGSSTDRFIAVLQLLPSLPTI